MSLQRCNTVGRSSAHPSPVGPSRREGQESRQPGTSIGTKPLNCARLCGSGAFRVPLGERDLLAGPSFASKRGFTLIELLIVCAIIPILMGTVFGLIASLGIAACRASARIDADEAASSALARWRDDVAMAAGVELSPDGKSMIIRRIGRIGQTGRISAEGSAEEGVTTIRYALAPGGRFTRAIEPSGGELSGAEPALPIETLCENASDVEFHAVGKGYRLSWVIEDSDGIQTRKWRQTGFATPL